MDEVVSLYDRTMQEVEDRRQRIIDGGVNCIPSPFKRFQDDFCGIEQDTYYCVTSFTKGGKCFAKGTQVRMADNSLKNVEDIQVGDWVLSPGMEPAKQVIGTNKGVAPLYRITSQMYEPFTVNGEHVMYLYDHFSKSYKTMTMNELYPIYKNMKWDYFCRKYKMVASDVVSFDGSKELPLDPYFYGLWLGDGDTKDTYITTPDQKIIDYLHEYADTLGLKVSSYFGDRSCGKYRICREHNNERNFKELLGSVCHWDKKSINSDYLNASVADRFALLAGMIDTDGYLNPNRTGYEISFQHESLIDDVVSLARSLGLTSCKSKKFNDEYQKYYYVANISGVNCASIPTRVKKIIKTSRVDRRFYTFKIEEVGTGEFYGFEVGGNHLFLLKDYSIVHNSQLVSFMFIFQAVIYAYFAKEQVDFKILYFPLEETRERIMQRFMSWLLFKKSHQALRISPKELRSTTQALDEQVIDRLRQFDMQDILKYFEDHVIFPTESPNPTGIYKFCKQYAEEHGTVTKRTIQIKDEFGVPQDVEVFDSYTQDNPNEYRMIIIDTINLIDTERGMTLKQSIDKLSEYCAKYLRNRYHYSPIIIQQQAFESEGNDAFKLGRVRPSVAGLGDSKYVSRDADIVLGLFSPFRFGITEYFGYDITLLKDHIRFLEVIVNRNGEMGGLLPLWFDGAVCDFKELPKPEDKPNIDALYNLAKTLATTGKYPVTVTKPKIAPTLLLNRFRSFKHIINFN